LSRSRIFKGRLAIVEGAFTISYTKCQKRGFFTEFSGPFEFFVWMVAKAFWFQSASADIDETMANTLASVDKAYTQVSPQENLPQLQVTENIFYTDGSLVDDVAGFAVHNRHYETEYQLAKPSSFFLAKISAIRMALEHIIIRPRGRYLFFLIF
jgi:hypothetical protein